MNLPLQRPLRFFMTAPQPCPYLPGREERKVFAALPPLDGARINDSLSQAGFRRSQAIAYRPNCESCDACTSARIPVADYHLSRSERRALARNADLEPCLVESEATLEQYDLLRRYLGARHAGGGMADMNWSDYVAMVEETTVRTHMVEYREREADGGMGRLVACVLVDLLSDGLSLVYSFYDPAEVKRSLGAYVILDHVRQAKAANLAYVYLGYLVFGARKMAYKARFSPLEILKPQGWMLISAREREEAQQILNPTGPERDRPTRSPKGRTAGLIRKI